MRSVLIPGDARVMPVSRQLVIENGASHPARTYMIVNTDSGSTIVQSHVGSNPWRMLGEALDLSKNAQV